MSTSTLPPTQTADTPTAPPQAAARPLFLAKRELPALRLAQTPRAARKLARVMLWLFILTPVVLIFVPWQQTVTGKGRVIAFDPVERQQTIQAPIEGRIKQWHVEEGSVVKKGDRILEIEDNDPHILERLQREYEQLQNRLAETQESASDLQSQVDAEIRAKEEFLESMDRRLMAAGQEIIGAQESLKGVQAELKQAELNYQRRKDLFENPLQLASQFDVEVAERAYKNALAKVETGRAGIARAQANKLALEADRRKGANDADSKIQKARSDVRKAQADVASYRSNLEPMRGRLERQKTMEVRAPSDGTILRIQANAAKGGGFVKAGDRLADLVPNTQNLVAELWIEGNDAPLIPALMKAREARDADLAHVHVRLQFEGWPALQFAGWPSVAIGTFGGRVRLVDATDNGKGQFRVVIEPDPDGEPWPASDYLRQGVRVHGWVMLNEVPLGFEVWRRLNGFPPIVSKQPPDGESNRGSGK